MEEGVLISWGAFVKHYRMPALSEHRSCPRGLRAAWMQDSDGMQCLTRPYPQYPQNALSSRKEKFSKAEGARPSFSCSCCKQHQTEIQKGRIIEHQICMYNALQEERVVKDHTVVEVSLHQSENWWVWSFCNYIISGGFGFAAFG